MVEYDFSHKEQQNEYFTGKWMEVEVTVLNKISQTQRENYIICGLFVWGM